MALHVNLYYIARLFENVKEEEKGWREKKREIEKQMERALSLIALRSMNH